MRDTIKALLFDFTKENLEAHIAENINMTSGNNIVNDIIQFENEKFIDNPFVKLIDIEYESVHDEYGISNEQMSKVLEIDNNNICFYEIHNRKLSKDKRRCHASTVALDPLIIANKEMFEEVNAPIFEIKYRNEMSSWQAIAGKFILIHGNTPGGLLGIYNPIRKSSIENFFKRDFQIRFSGNKISTIAINHLHRICNDPFSSDLIKIIDPSTSQILFDSQLMKDNSSEKSGEIWRKFDERYR